MCNGKLKSYLAGIIISNCWIAVLGFTFPYVFSTAQMILVAVTLCLSVFGLLNILDREERDS